MTIKAKVLHDVFHTGEIPLANKDYMCETSSATNDPEYSRVLFVSGREDVGKEVKDVFLRILEVVSNEVWYSTNIQKYGFELTEDEYEQMKPLLEAVGWEIEEEDFYVECSGT